MSWFDAAALSFVAFTATQAIYVLLQAFVGWGVGATVEVVSVGSGPVLFEKVIRGVKCRLSAIPGGYTKFAGQDGDLDHDNTSESVSPDGVVPYGDVTILGRAVMLLSGPTSSVLIGLACVAIPVLIGADQLVVDAEVPARWAKIGVPNLTVSQQPSTWMGQRELFEKTILEFSIRTATFRSLKGWSGFFGWLSTLGSAGKHSVAAWFTCFGVTMIGIGLLNFLPIPVLNGGHLVFLVVEAVYGKPSERLLIGATYIGMLFVLVMMVRVILADIAWLWT